jgi:UDP-N-acetylglucosamine transferase subunit ALG13
MLRMLAEADLKERCIVQHGSTAPIRFPGDVEWVQWLPYQELTELISRARVVVCHAGVGTVMTCLKNAQRPIVVPRLRAFGEHVDDHQLEITKRLEQDNRVFTAISLGDLKRYLSSTQRAVRPDRTHGRLAEHLREAILAQP